MVALGCLKLPTMPIGDWTWITSSKADIIPIDQCITFREKGKPIQEFMEKEYRLTCNFLEQTLNINFQISKLVLIRKISILRCIFLPEKIEFSFLQLFFKCWPSIGENLFDHHLWSICQSSLHTLQITFSSCYTEWMNEWMNEWKL